MRQYSTQQCADDEPSTSLSLRNLSTKNHAPVYLSASPCVSLALSNLPTKNQAPVYLPVIYLALGSSLVPDDGTVFDPESLDFKILWLESGEITVKKALQLIS